MGFDSPGLIHNHEVPSSILGPATKKDVLVGRLFCVSSCWCLFHHRTGSIIYVRVAHDM